MRGYVVTLMDDPRSVAVADRCIASGVEHGFDIKQWGATRSVDARNWCSLAQIPIGEWDQQWSHRDAVLGNFASQCQIWHHTAEGSEPVAIFEHDAVIDAPLPPATHFDYVLQIGHPSFGKFRTKPEPGVYPLFSKPGGYFPGAHAYIVTPEGAKRLIKAAKTDGAQPVDLFLSSTRFPWLQELQPWIAHVKETFSTIQKPRGCLAKHQYSPGFQCEP